MSRTWTMPRKWNRRWPVRSNGVRAAATANWRKLAERRALDGLTSRGTKPKRRREHRLLLREVDALASQIMLDIDSLAPAARVRAFRIFKMLSTMRGKLT